MNPTPQNSKPRAGTPAPSRADSSHSTTAPGISNDAWDNLTSIRHLVNKVTLGNRLEILRRLPTSSADLVITKPPLKLISQWPEIFAEVVRILKPGAFCVSYALAQPTVPMVDAWLSAGLLGRSVFAWQALSKGVVVGVFSKGKHRNRRSVPHLPESLDEMPEDRHERMAAFITPLIERYSRAGQLVLDPFADEAVCVSIHGLNRPYILIEDEEALNQELETPNSQD